MRIPFCLPAPLAVQLIYERYFGVGGHRRVQIIQWIYWLFLVTPIAAQTGGDLIAPRRLHDAYKVIINPAGISEGPTIRLVALSYCELRYLLI